MSEKSEIITHIVVGGETFEVRRENLQLYKHLGANALYDHCFIEIPERGGVFVWVHDPSYAEFSQAALDHQAVVHMNLPKPHEKDVENYMLNVTADLAESDYIPDEWAPKK